MLPGGFVGEAGGIAPPGLPMPGLPMPGLPIGTWRAAKSISTVKSATAESAVTARPGDRAVAAAYSRRRPGSATAGARWRDPAATREARGSRELLAGIVDKLP